MNAKQVALVAVLVAAILAVIVVRGIYSDQGTAPRTEAGSTPKLVVVTGGSSPYWQAIRSGAKKAGSELGADVEVRMPEKDEDAVAQTEILSLIDPMEFDGVALSPLEAADQTRVIDQLAKHAFVVTVDSDAPLSTRMNYVGASNLDAGQKCAELVKEALPEGGKVAVLIANETKQNVVDRRIGFIRILTPKASDDVNGSEQTDANYEIVDFLIDQGDNARCEKQLRELIESDDEIDCIVGMNSYHGPVLVKLANDETLKDDVKLIAFDTESKTLDGVESGVLFATIAQDPYQYGYEAVNILNSFCRRSSEQLPPAGLYATTTIQTKVVKQGEVKNERTKFDRYLEHQTNGDAEN